MKSHNLIHLILYLILFGSCSGRKLISNGTVSPIDFHSELDFTTQKNVIFLPVEINGIEKNFLFDTGAEYSIIQRDSIFGRTVTISGASKRKHKYGSETVKSLKIGEVEFVNTFALNGNMVGLKEQIPNFGGIIGQPIISKANWLIDYPNKKLKIDNNELSDNTFQTLLIEREDGAPYTFINIKGQEYKVVIDLGSSSILNAPKESKLARDLSKNTSFQNNTRDRYTVGGLQSITEQIGVVPLVKIENIEFKNVKININTSSQPRIGIGFFKNCMIYIDNTNKLYRIKQFN